MLKSLEEVLGDSDPWGGAVVLGQGLVTGRTGLVEFASAGAKVGPKPPTFWQKETEERETKC